MDDPFEQAKTHFFAALGRQQAGDFVQAERLYQASLAHVPGRASTLINLAAVQLRLARPGDALRSADAALVAERDSVDALLHRATALAQLGHPQAALAAFQRLLAIDPRHAAAWSGSGTLLREMRRLDEAALAFREALRHGAEGELHDFYRASVEAGAATPTSSTATSSASCATRRIASWSSSSSSPRAATHASSRRSTSAAGRACAARSFGRWSRG